MTSEENAEELKQIAARLAAMDKARADQLILALTNRHAELRWLARDYDDEQNGDWTR